MTPNDPIQQDSSGSSTTPAANSGLPAGVVVPDEARQKYPDLVELILKSESMNTEERNYWLQVLPVMTPDQIAELRDILETEKKKLAAIDAKYAAKKDPNTPQVDPVEIERKRKEAREQRKNAELQNEASEQEKEQELLAQLSSL